MVVNVQPVHLETMGTIENIARAKGEMVECLSPTGIACLNYDDPRVRAMAERCKGRVLFYGSDPAADIRPERITADIPLLGSYRTQLALAAFSVGSCFDMPDEQMNRALARLRTEKGRLVRLPGIHGTTVIDDTYNASLSSSLVALEVLANHAAARRVAFLGDMLELGSEEAAAHRIVLERALEVADQVVLVGPRFAQAAHGFEHRLSHRLTLFPDSPAAVEALRGGTPYAAGNGDVLLVKGSAGIRMERVAAHFLSPELDPLAVLVRQSAEWRG
jgi:UDP-N-acetylmuramoyl-tripeptide--D-alanyl-D-alanine ligase